MSCELTSHWNPDIIAPSGVKYAMGRWRPWENALVRNGLPYREVLAMTGRHPTDVQAKFRYYGRATACIESLI